MKKIYTIKFLALAILIFSLNLCHAQNESEPNDLFNQSNTINFETDYTGKISEQNDIDIFKVNLTELGIIKYTLNESANNLKLETRIYSPTQNHLLNNTTNTDGGTFSISISACELGEYFIYTRDRSNNWNATDNYSFRVSFTPFSEVDPTECNNSFSTAYEMGTQEEINAIIAPIREYDFPTTFADVDIYSFDITEPGIMKFKLSNVPENIKLITRIYNPDKTELLSRTNIAEGQGYTMEISACDLGLHYFRVLSADDDAYSIEEPYKIEFKFTPFSEVDQYECNESFSKAYELSAGEEVRALIGPLYGYDFPDAFRDKDYYKINIPEPGFFTFKMTSVPEGLGINARIYDDNQSEILSKTNAPNGQGFILEYSLCDQGDYYFFINADANQYDSEEQYVFDIDFTPFSLHNEEECNNSFSKSTAIEICDTIKGLFAPRFINTGSNSDEDFFKVNLSEGETYNISLIDIGEEVAPNVLVYDSEFTLKANYLNNEGVPLFKEFTAEKTEIHYFSLNSYFGDVQTETPYKFTVGCEIISSTSNINGTNMSIYPNPATNQLFVESLLPIGTAYQIINSLGLNLVKGTISDNPIIISNLESGIYYLITNETTTTKSVHKFIKI